MLWRITGEEKYKQALDCAFYTAHEYTYIDAADKFFRRSTAADTPFTDGISYDFDYPDTVSATYGRDENGDITIHVPEAAQHFMEQKAVRFRINKDSKLRVTYGGVCKNGDPVYCKVMVNVNPAKADTEEVNWYGLTLPRSTVNTVKQYDIDLGQLSRVTTPEGEDYLIAEARACSDYGGCTWEERFEDSIYDGRAGTVIEAEFPDDSAGLIIGFWLTAEKKVKPVSIVYRADADFNLRLVDSDNWRWWWMLPNTNNEWRQVTLNPEEATLSGYQPDHTDADPKPSAPNFDKVDQVTILPDSTVDHAHFAYYCVNDIPPVFNKDDGYILTFRIALRGGAEFDAKVGDCTIVDYRLDSLAYCPGTIPFTNSYLEGSEQLGAWHGMPYPGYQYPFMYSIHKDDRYKLWLDNQIQFLYDSQLAYQQQIGELGPGCAAYIWNRWDNYTYGEADTWTTFHWGDDHPWAGYQPRAFHAACRCWYELKLRGKEVPEALTTYIENWVNWLGGFVDRFNGHTPNEFPTAPDKAVWVEDDFNAHMCGLWLAGCCWALLAGATNPNYEKVVNAAIKELGEGFTITSIPNKPINGAWSPAARESSDNGMAFGFYSGEAFRALGLYVTYKTYGANANIYRDLAISDHSQAVLDVTLTIEDDALKPEQ